jgi:hypothetical protein
LIQALTYFWRNWHREAPVKLLTTGRRLHNGCRLWKVRRYLCAVTINVECRDHSGVFLDAPLRGEQVSTMPHVEATLREFACPLGCLLSSYRIVEVLMMEGGISGWFGVAES